jgi:NAD(P)H-flavin reductase
MPITKDRFTSKFFQGKVSNDSEKFLICGPPRMMNGTPPALIENGINPNKIDLV